MGKALFVAEKPSVAMDFVKLLNVNGKRNNGYIEGEKSIFTWCVGHMVTMSYPEVYDEKLKFWNLRDLPFLPREYKYEVISSASNQFNIVSNLMNREDVD
ncbi:type IA DNA topoisomerase, partial [Clostridium perfringens]|nr:type IA DNA topoisomerase [Clostridium perfringens]